MQGDKRLKALVALVAAAWAVLVAFAVIDDDEPGPPTPAPEVKAVVPEATVVDNADPDAKADNVVPLGPDAREVTADYLEADGRSDVVPADGNELRGDDEAGPVAKLAPPFAAEEVPGCRTRFLTTNWSYRVGGTSVKWLGWHYTAGRDIPNSRADVDGLTAYGNNPSARVSWHFNLDKDGNCDYNVPIRYKAWTIGNANSYSVNVEVSGSGEPPYLRPAGIAQAKRIVAYVREAYGVPVRVGSMSNCSAGNAGQVTHYMGGVCSGGHTDIKPHDFAAFVKSLASCDATCRQRAVVAGRRRKHAATHAALEAAKCRKRTHSNPLSAYTRGECRKLKRRDIAQRRGVRRAKRRLAQL